MIPEFLYRGDSDQKGIRYLRDTIDFYQLQTNLINAGQGRKIKETDLLQLIEMHVNFGWDKTHFLSFSESEEIAFKYGMNTGYTSQEEKVDGYINYSGHEKNWNFAIITIASSIISWNKIGNGIYEGLYHPNLRIFEKIEFYRIIAINVIEALANEKGNSISKVKSERDKEWLILPATQVQFKNAVEYSAILDGACFSEIRKFRIKNL